ncbi:MAG TPA: hypothetical protein VHE61_06515 [Opitutaceae bacterium]|nr:hypothetical protein [Opitutaceae bacterium]
MSIEFGWWNREEDGTKIQVHVAVHGGNIEWLKKLGHHEPWETYAPTDDDRTRLVSEAERRLPRRLITQKQFDEIRRLSTSVTPGRIAGRRHRSSPEL